MPTRRLTTHPVHITYRLKGSVPTVELVRITKDYQEELHRLKSGFKPEDRYPSSKRFHEFQQQIARFYLDTYLRYDEFLDSATQGPRFLDTPAAKKLIIDSWLHLAKTDLLEIYAISVMSNHVHVLLRAREAGAELYLPGIMERHRHFTATQLNRLHDKKGRRVWDRRIYDRTVRTGAFTNALWYVLNNPVKAGITEDPLNWCGNWWNEELVRPFIVARRAI